MSVDGLVDEHAGQWREVVGILSSIVVAGSALAAMALNLRVALQVVGKTVGNNRALLDDAYAFGSVLVDLVDEQGVVGAAQNDCVDIGTLRHELVDVLLHEVVGTVTITLAVLDKWYPHGAGVPMNLEVRIHPFNLDIVAAACYGARRAEYTDVSSASQFTYFFHSRTHDTQDTAVGSKSGEVVLLNGSQRFGRSRVARQDDQVASLFEKMFYGLKSELIDQFAGARAVWLVLRPRIVCNSACSIDYCVLNGMVKKSDIVVMCSIGWSRMSIMS